MTAPNLGALYGKSPSNPLSEPLNLVKQLLNLPAKYVPNVNPFSQGQLPAVATKSDPLNKAQDSQSSASTAPAEAASAATTAAPATTPQDPASNEALTQQFQNINPLALQLFNSQVLVPWMQSLQKQQAGESQQYVQDESAILNQPALKGNPQAAAMLAQVPSTAANQNTVMTALGRDVMAAPAASEASSQQAAIQSSLTQAIAQQQKLAAYQDPSYQLLAQQAQLGTTVPTQSPSYLAAQAAGASPQVLQAIAAAASQSSLLPGGVGTTTAATLPAP